MKKHSHYFKPVHHLDEVDIYRICELFQVDDTSGAIQHALKKILLPGKRGAGKDRTKDIREAQDSLKRWLDMQEENKRLEERVMGMRYRVVNLITPETCMSMEQLHAANLSGTEVVEITRALEIQIRADSAELFKKGVL